VPTNETCERLCPRSNGWAEHLKGSVCVQMFRLVSEPIARFATVQTTPVANATGFDRILPTTLRHVHYLTARTGLRFLGPEASQVQSRPISWATYFEWHN
jgi:hypothetical protein